MLAAQWMPITLDLTGVAYGDSSSIYRIGTLADGTNVYYIPDSLGVFDNTTNNGKKRWNFGATTPNNARNRTIYWYDRSTAASP